MLIIPNIGIKVSIFFGLLKAGGVLQRTHESRRADRATRREVEKSETSQLASETWGQWDMNEILNIDYYWLIPESSNMAGKSPS